MDLARSVYKLKFKNYNLWNNDRNSSNMQLPLKPPITISTFLFAYRLTKLDTYCSCSSSAYV